MGGHNRSLVVCWARCPAQCSIAGSNLLWAEFFPEGGIFPWSWHGFWLRSPPNSFGWEYKPRSCLCTHAFHRNDSKDPDIHALDGWMLATKHTQHAPSMKTECDYLNGWIKNSHIRKNLTQNDEPQKYSWGTQKKKKNMHQCTNKQLRLLWLCTHVIY